MPLDPRISQMILEAVDTRVNQRLRSQPYTAYGVVASVDLSSRKASVYVSGDAIASGGFSFGATTAPAVGEAVRVVIDSRGDRYIDSALGLSDNVVASSNAWASWPMGGGRQTVVSGGLALGYPTDTGLLISWNVNEYRAVQHFYEPHYSGRTGRSWYRTRHSTGISSNGGWGAWSPLGVEVLGSAFVRRASATAFAVTSGSDNEIMVTPAITPPASGAYRLWVAWSVTWLASVAGRRHQGIKVSQGGTDMGWLIFQQEDGYLANEYVTLSGMAFVDSTGGVRTTPPIDNTSGTITVRSMLRQTNAGNLTVYGSTTTDYVSQISAWITRLAP